MGSKVEIAKVLRKRETKSEAVVWEKIRNRQFQGLKFRRQRVINGFVVDFYCPELKLAIEIDGKVHRNQGEFDVLRQTVIESENIKMVRIESGDVEKTETILNEWIGRNMKTLPVAADRIPPLHAFKHGEGVRG